MLYTVVLQGNLDVLFALTITMIAQATVMGLQNLENKLISTWYKCFATNWSNSEHDG